jgi:hypothetical protein
MEVRPQFPKKASPINVRDLVLMSRDLATRHVESFNLLIVNDNI